MLMLQCPGCMAQAFAECTCPPGHPENVGAHHPECSHANPDALVRCGCCPEDHDHAAAANACPGGHDDAPCPDKKDCRVWKGAIAEAFHPDYSGDHPVLMAMGHKPGDDVPDCPGGHCHKDVKDCTVCRPLIITMVPGTVMEMVPGRGV